MYPERKSKLNIGAGIFFLLLSIYSGLLLLFGYLIPGVPFSFAFALSITEFLTYFVLMSSFFSGKVSHVFTALLAILAICEIASLIYTITQYSKYDITLPALEIVLLVVAILAICFSVVISAAAVKNRGAKMSGILFTWLIPGAVLIITGFITFIRNIKAFGYYFEAFFDKLGDGDFEDAVAAFANQFSLISLIIIGLGLIFGLTWLVKPTVKGAAPQQTYNPYQPGFAPGQGYNPYQQQNFAPQPGYAPQQNFAQPQQNAEPPKPVGYDPMTGAPIYEKPAETTAPKTPIGYDPMTGAPIYSED